MTILNPVTREQIQYYIINGRQTPKAIKALQETIIFNPSKHDGLTLEELIEQKTEFNKYAFVFIDVLEDKYNSIIATRK
jgi:hypothetical protein